MILAFCANNDISNILANDDNDKHSKPKPYFMIEHDELVLFDSEGNPLDYDAYNRPHETSSWQVRSHLVDFVKHTLSGLSAAPDVSPAELEERYQRVDERLNEEVEAAGGKLLVMLLPIIINPREIDTMTGGTFERRFETPAGLVTIRSAEPRERLAELSQRLDIPLLDPTQDFIGFVTENGLLETTWPDVGDRHFSEVGHGFLAGWLSDRIDLLAPAE